MEAPKGCAGSFGVGKMSSFPALWPSLGASLRAKSPGRQGLGSGLGAEVCQLPLPASSQAFAAASGDKMIFFIYFFFYPADSASGEKCPVWLSRLSCAR